MHTERLQTERGAEGMKPIAEKTKDEARRIRYILTDIDDTLTTKGKLPAEAYSALWKLHNEAFR